MSRPKRVKRGRIPFGRHKGKRYRDVPKDYLEWIISSNNQRYMSAAVDELTRRDAKEQREKETQ